MPATLAIPDTDVVIHALGPGYGESLICVIGSRLVIGIDCCTPLVAPTENGRSYLQNVLGNMRDPYLIWLITHFHYDHFQGVCMLLDQIEGRVARLVVPNDYVSADLAFDAALDAMEDTGEEAAFHLARDEYLRLRARLDTPELRNVIQTAVGHWPLLECKLKPRSGSQIPLRAELWGPSYQRGSRLVGEAVSEFGRGQLNRSAANHSSYMLRVIAGDTCALFLGDAPTESSVAWLAEDVDSRRALVLKVAHHGATDGTNPILLEKIRCDAPSPAFAIVCPFRNHGLPRPTILKLLRARGFEVVRALEAIPSSAAARRLRQRVNNLTPESKRWRFRQHVGVARQVRTPLRMMRT